MKVSAPNRRAYFGMLAAAASLVAALAYHVVCGEHGYLALRREKQQLGALQKQSHQLQQENDALEKEITALKTDRKTIEKRAREDSLMAKPNEIIIRYSDSKTGSDGGKTQGSTPSNAPSDRPVTP